MALIMGSPRTCKNSMLMVPPVAVVVNVLITALLD